MQILMLLDTILRACCECDVFFLVLRCYDSFMTNDAIRQPWCPWNVCFNSIKEKSPFEKRGLVTLLKCHFLPVDILWYDEQILLRFQLVLYLNIWKRLQQSNLNYYPAFAFLNVVYKYIFLKSHIFLGAKKQY